MRGVLTSRLDRPFPGDGVTVRDAAAVLVRRPGHLATAAPNAPLLMRIVRHPYALATGRPTRVGYLPVPELEADVDPRAERRAATEDRARPPARSPVGRRPLPFTLIASRACPFPQDPSMGGAPSFSPAPSKASR